MGSLLPGLLLAEGLPRALAGWDLASASPLSWLAGARALLGVGSGGAGHGAVGRACHFPEDLSPTSATLHPWTQHRPSLDSWPLSDRFGKSPHPSGPYLLLCKTPLDHRVLVSSQPWPRGRPAEKAGHRNSLLRPDLLSRLSVSQTSVGSTRLAGPHSLPHPLSSGRGGLTASHSLGNQASGLWTPEAEFSHTRADI